MSKTLLIFFIAVMALVVILAGLKFGEYVVYIQNIIIIFAFTYLGEIALQTWSARPAAQMDVTKYVTKEDARDIAYTELGKLLEMASSPDDVNDIEEDEMEDNIPSGITTPERLDENT